MRVPLLRLGLAILLSAVAVPRLAGQSLTDEERLQFADGLYARGLYDLAAREYEGFLADFPQSAKRDVAHFRLGESRRQLGDLTEAEKHFRRVFADHPDSTFRARAGFRRADIFLQTGKHAAAVDLFRMVLEQDPPPDIASACLYFVGKASLELSRTDEAVRAFNDLIERYPSSEFHSYALLSLGGIYGSAAVPEEGQPDPEAAELALSLYRRVAEDPQSARVGAEALFQIGELYFRRGDFAGSAEAYNRLLTEYPEDERVAQVRLQAAWADHNAGLYARALGIARAALEEAGTEGREEEWLYLRANCERQLMKHADAVSTYGLQLQRFPRGEFAASARYERAVTFYKTGDFENAVAECAGMAVPEALKKDVYWLLAESHSSLGDDDSAVQYYRLVVRECPGTDLARDATYRLAHKLQGKGEHREAARHYRMVVEGWPDHELAPAALFAAGSCLAAGEEHAEAVRDWDVLVRKYPSSGLRGQALYQKAMGEVHLRRDDDATASLQQLVREFPDSSYLPEAHYWLGMLHKEAERWHDAERELRAALDSAPRKELERDAEFHLALVLQKQGSAEEAARLLQKLLSTPLKAEFSPALLEWLAEHALEQGKPGQALESAQLLVEAGRDPVSRQRAWSLVGRSRSALGEAAAAEEAYRNVLAEEAATPVAAEAALRVGELRLAAGDQGHAGEYFGRAARMASGDGTLAIRAHAYAGLGRAAKASKDIGAAARYFMSVAILFDDDDLVPECLYEAAAAFRELGQAEGAKQTLDELVERYPGSRWAREALNAGE